MKENNWKKLLKLLFPNPVLLSQPSCCHHHHDVIVIKVTYVLIILRKAGSVHVMHHLADKG